MAAGVTMEACAPNDACVLRGRIDALVALYLRIERGPMQGVALLNPALRVAAVGFELLPLCEAPAAETAAAVGVMVTPWFMNLLWFPLRSDPRSCRVGEKVRRQVGTECFEFIGAHEPGFGHHEACSLYSPVFEFADQASALATAEAVLAALRKAAPGDAAARPAAGVDMARRPQPAAVPGRRAFLLGRRSGVGNG